MCVSGSKPIPVPWVSLAWRCASNRSRMFLNCSTWAHVFLWLSGVEHPEVEDKNWGDDEIVRSPSQTAQLKWQYTWNTSSMLFQHFSAIKIVTNQGTSLLWRFVWVSLVPAEKTSQWQLFTASLRQLNLVLGSWLIPSNDNCQHS